MILHNLILHQNTLLYTALPPLPPGVTVATTRLSVCYVSYLDVSEASHIPKAVDLDLRSSTRQPGSKRKRPEIISKL